MKTIEDLKREDEQLVGSFLSFRMDNELFAVDVKKVIEILEVPNITKIPRAPKYMAGIINLRGRVLPLVDTRVKFGLAPIQYHIDTCIIVIEIEVEGETLQIGTLVDTVLEVLEIPVDSIQPSPSIDARYRLDFIQGMFKTEEEFVMLLDLGKVFSLDDVQFMQESHPEPKSA